MVVRRVLQVWMFSLALSGLAAAAYDMVGAGQWLLRFPLKDGGTYTAKVDIQDLPACGDDHIPALHTSALLEDGTVQSLLADLSVEVFLGDVRYHFDIRGRKVDKDIVTVGCAHAPNGAYLADAPGTFSPDLRPPLKNYRVRPLLVELGANDGHGGQAARSFGGSVIYEGSTPTLGCYKRYGFPANLKFTSTGEFSAFDYQATWPAEDYGHYSRHYVATVLSQQSNPSSPGCLAVNFSAQYEEIGVHTPPRPVQLDGRLREVCGGVEPSF